MYETPTINQSIADFIVQNQVSPTSGATKNTKRLDLVQKGITSAKNDFMRGIDLALISDPELRNEVNYEFRKAGMDEVNYSLLTNSLKRAGKIDEDTYIRASGTIDTTTSPGGTNFLQTTVSDILEKRVEDLGLVKKEVSNFDLQNNGNLQLPTYNAFAKTAFTAEGSTLSSIGSTVEGGLSYITLDPKRHGGYLPIFNSFIQKLSGKNLVMLMDILAESFTRGIEDQILNGNGSGINATGMNQNATSITFNGDALTTFKIAVQNVSDAQKGGLNGLVAFMSTASWMEFMELFRDLQNNRPGIIDPASRTIYGVRVVVTDVIANTGSAGAKTSVVTVGYPKTYKWGQTSLVTTTDNFTGLLTSTTNIATQLFASGKPAFNDSFAKFSLPNMF